MQTSLISSFDIKAGNKMQCATIQENKQRKRVVRNYINGRFNHFFNANSNKTDTFEISDAKNYRLSSVVLKEAKQEKNISSAISFDSERRLNASLEKYYNRALDLVPEARGIFVQAINMCNEFQNNEVESGSNTNFSCWLNNEGEFVFEKRNGNDILMSGVFSLKKAIVKKYNGYEDGAFDLYELDVSSSALKRVCKKCHLQGDVTFAEESYFYNQNGVQSILLDSSSSEDECCAGQVFYFNADSIENFVDYRKVYNPKFDDDVDVTAKEAYLFKNNLLTRYLQDLTITKDGTQKADKVYEYRTNIVSILERYLFDYVSNADGSEEAKKAVLLDVKYTGDVKEVTHNYRQLSNGKRMGKSFRFKIIYNQFQ